MRITHETTVLQQRPAIFAAMACGETFGSAVFSVLLAAVQPRRGNVRPYPKLASQGRARQHLSPRLRGSNGESLRRVACTRAQNLTQTASSVIHEFPLLSADRWPSPLRVRSWSCFSFVDLRFCTTLRCLDSGGCTSCALHPCSCKLFLCSSRRHACWSAPARASTSTVSVFTLAFHQTAATPGAAPRTAAAGRVADLTLVLP